jgi:hypothetical protein
MIVRYVFSSLIVVIVQPLLKTLAFVLLYSVVDDVKTFRCTIQLLNRRHRWGGTNREIDPGLVLNST